MNEHEVSSRLDRLERENRRWKRLVVGVGALAATLGLVAMATPVCDVITAERLVLRDTSGRQRFTIDAYNQDTPTITWSDKSGRTMARLAVEQDGLARITYYDAQGKPRANERVGTNDAPKTDEAKKDGAPTPTIVMKN